MDKIRLDLQNNEIVFSNMRNPMEISNALGSIKGVKMRRFEDRIFLSVGYVDKIGKALQDYKGKFSPTKNYRALLEFLKTEEIVIDWYPSYCTIKGGRLPFDTIIPKTSYFDKKFLHMKAYKNGRISGMVHLFDIVKKRFPSGLLEIVLGCLNEKGIPYKVNKHFEYPAPYHEWNPKFPFTPSEDQLKSVEALDKANNGIGKLPTGFGKTSYVSVALIAKKGVNTMFLANQRILINDAKSDFEDAFEGEKIGVIGDGEYDPQKITVASIQGVIAALQPPTMRELDSARKQQRLAELELEYDPNNIELKKKVTRAKNKLKKMMFRIEKEKDVRAYLKTVDMFIIDEGQVIGTSMWNKFFEACPAAYRYTVTATDTRTDGGRIEIIAATGERRYESTADEQIAKGRLSEFKGYFKMFNHGIDPSITKSMNISYHQAYDAFIVNNNERNQYLCDWLQKWKQEGHSILALVTRKTHGEIIQEILTNRGMVQGKDFEYVDGQTNKTIRQDIIKRFRNSEFSILIGTSIFDVGFNAKNASKMVRFNAGSSEVRETQRAGRTVRKRDDGTIGETIDLIDMNVPYFQSQGWKRYELLKAEFGSKRAVILEGEIKTITELAVLEDVANNMPEDMDRIELLRAINDFKSMSESALNEDDVNVVDDLLEQPHLRNIVEDIYGKIDSDFLK